MKKLILIPILLLMFQSAVLLAQDDYKKQPGYIDFGTFEGFENNNEFTEVLIEAPLLNLIAKMSKNEDDDFAKLLNGLKLIRVNSFQADKKSQEDIKARISRIEKELLNKKWDRLVKIKDREDQVYIYVKNVDNEFSGLVIMSFDKGGDASFINIVGKIDLESIGKLSKKFDIPELDLLKK